MFWAALVTDWVVKHGLTQIAAEKKWNTEYAGQPHPDGGTRNTVSRQLIGRFIKHYETEGVYRTATVGGRKPIAMPRRLRMHALCRTATRRLLLTKQRPPRRSRRSRSSF